MQLPRICLLMVSITLSACATLDEQDRAPTQVPVDPAQVSEPVPRVEPYSRYGNPASYEVAGERYVLLQTHRGYRERGLASWYGTKFHGRRTSSGEDYDMFAMTAAHKTLPIPCYVRVTNLENQRSIIVRVNDRGPFHPNRIIDLSYVAAAKLDMLGKGTAKVEVTAIDASAPEEATAPVVVANTEEAHGTSAASSRLYIQVAAYAQRLNAEKARAELIMLVAESITIKTADDGLYKLWVGPLDSVEDADRVSNQLLAQGYPQPHVVID